MDKQFLCDMLANCTLFSVASFPGLVPRPSLPPVFDCLLLQTINNWRWGRPGNEASSV